MTYAIELWMVDELGLRNGDLLVYALVHSYSRDGVGCYFGTLKDLAKATGLSVRHAERVLDRLVDTGLIERSEGFHGGRSTTDYMAVKPAFFDLDKMSTKDDKMSTYDDILSTSPDPSPAPSAFPSPQNNNINPPNPTTNPAPDPTPTGDKRAPAGVDDVRIWTAEAGVPVRMTAAEHQKLCADYGAEDAEAAVMYLSAYKAEKPYKSKSDYLAIRRWVIDAVREKKARQVQTAAPADARAEAKARVARIAEGLRATRLHPEDYINYDGREAVKS